ncbi:PLP-dependent aminotransferase family protein [Ottowia thiooxydans]|uniref:MocR-like pyridoxine biosynthesis transcription factor PdxR n=1 Tax=Ottowia thiooxydans TaxID=219182 RepID=UPI000407DEE9|nr:PLP-dependent aminotransferase family protein [Ottowia thiooxydans]
MRRTGQTKWAELREITVDRDSTTQISRQIYLQLRQAIISRALPAGSRLPSSRILSERLQVSRTSVVTAFDNLLAEGFIEGKKGSGTFIAEHLPTVGGRGLMRAAASDSASLRMLSDAGYRYQDVLRESTVFNDRPFSPGRVSVDVPTIEAWRQITVRQAKSIATDVLGYGDLFGRESFRQVIAEYLRAFRSVNCTADQVIVTSGAQQGIDLAIRVLLNAEDPVWIEEPGYRAVQTALRAANIITVPVPVDESGLCVKVGLEKEPRPRAIFVTPSHQYPTGAVMSIERRYELLHAANEADAWVVEDDYDSEFRYEGAPLPSLQGLDQSSRVIYVGTLSKVLFPGIRTGFLVVPLDLVEAFRGARFLTDRGPPAAHHGVLEEFMREGYFTSHIRRMRQRYSSILEEFVPHLRSALEPFATIATPDCGMRFVAYLREDIDDREVAAEAARRGVVVRPISPMYLDGGGRSGLDICFTGYDRTLLMTAATRLGDSVRHVASRR